VREEEAQYFYKQRNTPFDLHCDMTSKRCTSSCSLVLWTQVVTCYGFVANKFGSLTWRKSNASQRAAVSELSKRNDEPVPVAMQVATRSVRANVATNKISVSLMSELNFSFIKHLVCRLKRARCPENLCLHLRNTISLRPAKCQPFVNSIFTACWLLSGGALPSWEANDRPGYSISHILWKYKFCNLKVYLSLYQNNRNDNLWDNEGVTPHILHVGTRL